VHIEGLTAPMLEKLSSPYGNELTGLEPKLVSGKKEAINREPESGHTIMPATERLENTQHEVVETTPLPTQQIQENYTCVRMKTLLLQDDLELKEPIQDEHQLHDRDCRFSGPSPWDDDDRDDEAICAPPTTQDDEYCILRTSPFAKRRQDTNAEDIKQAGPPNISTKGHAGTNGTGVKKATAPSCLSTRKADQLPCVQPTTDCGNAIRDSSGKSVGERRRAPDNLVVESDNNVNNGETGSDLARPVIKRRRCFGKVVAITEQPDNVQHVYSIVNQKTACIGGSGAGEAIYGELTMGSMHEMINAMIDYCALSEESRFLDVGSGIGKPNFHAAQYPGVAFSCGVELEKSRWRLSLSCLKAVLDAAAKQQACDNNVAEASCLRGNTVFLHTDITKAKSFDPFTHVYMFSIGFPPPLWRKLSEMWNQSQAPYLICYHTPQHIIHHHGFHVRLVAQMPTSMHGSKEGHMGYIYTRDASNRKPSTKRGRKSVCDPIFKKPLRLVAGGLPILQRNVTEAFDKTMRNGTSTRSGACYILR